MEAFPDRAEAIFARIKEVRGGPLNDPRFGSRMRGEGVRWEAIKQLFDVWFAKLGYEKRPPPRAGSSFRRPARRGPQLALF